MKKFLFTILFISLYINGYSLPPIVLKIKANYMVYSKAKDKLFVTVSSTDVNYGNELLIINPQTGIIENEIYVGSEPNEIKISAEEEYLYIILDGTPQIVRINLPTFKIDKYIQVNAGNKSTQYFAKHMTISPNDPKDIIVSRTKSNNYIEDVYLYKDGLMLKDSLSYFNAYNVSVLLSGSKKDTIYGYNDISTGYDFSVIAIKPTGLEFVRSYSNLISGFMKPIIYNDKIYSNNGEVVDLTYNPPMAIAKCKLDDNYDDVAINENLNQIVYARFDYWDNNLLYLLKYSNTKYNKVIKENIRIDSLPSGMSSPKISSFSYTYNNSLAFIVGDYFEKDNVIVLIPETSINGLEDQFSLNFSFYPNPVTNSFTIKEEYLTAEISDINGNLIETIQGKNVVDISGYSDGLYFIKFITKNKSQIFKLVKE
jgi:hypothetical protein